MLEHNWHVWLSSLNQLILSHTRGNHNLFSGTLLKRIYHAVYHTVFSSQAPQLHLLSCNSAPTLTAQYYALSELHADRAWSCMRIRLRKMAASWPVNASTEPFTKGRAYQTSFVKTLFDSSDSEIYSSLSI